MTELDHCVLGVIWREGPITAYGVRRRFSASPTAAWSSSSGSIYPAIRRLVAGGLVRTDAPSDARNTQALRATAKGSRVLKRWLGRVQEGLAGALADPIRTRVQFLAALPRADALAFLREADRDCRATLPLLRKLRAERTVSRRHEESWAMVGAVYELEARLKWLRYVRREVSRRARALPARRVKPSPTPHRSRPGRVVPFRLPARAARRDGLTEENP